jgi:hypothetical protein
MTTLCERYSVSDTCSSLPRVDANRNDPPKADELFREAALTLAIPLALALAVSFALPIAGFAVQ